MKNRIKILELISIKDFICQELDSLTYGSVEIRSRGKKKYLYIHYRDDGFQVTKYLGEYNRELHNTIISNTLMAQGLKKEIKKIDLELRKLNYNYTELDNRIKRNIDYAKRNLVDTIYKQAVLEGITTTYVDTESIIEGGLINNMTSEDVLKIVNLKHAWEFILNKYVISSKTDYYLLCEINKLIEEGIYYTAGEVRSVPVSIGGTNWSPTIPLASSIKEELESILNKNISDVDIAIELLLYVMKKQIFIDGNKRTAIIFCNHYLISKGKGLIVIPEHLTKKFKKLLISFYEGKSKTEIKDFIKQKCYSKI